MRLVGGNTDTEGRVEVYFNNEWGTVCGNHFDSAAASVVCRQLGFHGRSMAARYGYFREGSGQVLLENLACQGNESRLTDCDFPGWGSGCGHWADAGVFCEIGRTVFYL